MTWIAGIYVNGPDDLAEVVARIADYTEQSAADAEAGADEFAKGNAERYPSIDDGRYPHLVGGLRQVIVYAVSELHRACEASALDQVTETADA